MTQTKLCRELKVICLKEALAEKDPLKRKTMIEEYEKIRKLDEENLKTILEFIVKFTVPIAVPILGIITIKEIRFALDFDGGPDIFFREMAKMIMNITKPKI